MASNCQIPTPQAYVRQMLDYIDYSEELYGKRVLENSCGEGNILLEVVTRYIENAKKEKRSLDDIKLGLSRDVVAYEIDKVCITKCKKRLNKLVHSYGLKGIRWNIKNKDFLQESITNTYDYHDNFGLDFDVVFGPAYKGIPLAVVTAIALHELYGKEVRYCSNRKEVKDHGADAGNLLGSELHDGDRVVMVEDVTTSGKSIDETYPVLMGAANVDVKGLIVSLNRMEVGKGGVKTAQKEVQEKYGFPVASIVSMAEVTEYLHNREVQGRVVIDDAVKAALDAYYEQYGAKE